MGRGGRRPNQTGRPKNAVPTKLVRFPVDVDRDALLHLAEDLRSIVLAWQPAKVSSSPRYDQAKLLLGELERLLEGLELADAHNNSLG